MYIADLKKPAASGNYWDFLIFIQRLFSAKGDLIV